MSARGEPIFEGPDIIFLEIAHDYAGRLARQIVAWDGDLDWATVDDLVQESLLTLRKKLHSNPSPRFDRPTDSKWGYLRKIAYRKCLNHWRKVERRSEQLYDPSTLSEIAGSSHDITENIEFGIFKEDVLGDRERQILELDGDYTSGEIGQQLGISAEAVRKAKGRALKKLREALIQLNDEETEQ